MIFLTANQNAYWRNVEDARSNRAEEEIARLKHFESARANLANEGLKARELTEKERANLEQERLTSIGQNKQMIGTIVGSALKGAGSIVSRLV